MPMMQQATARTTEREAFYDRNRAFNKAPLWERLHGSVTARPTTRHWNFQRYLKTFGVITMVGASAILAMPIGKAQARGDFSLTCKNIQLDAVGGSKSAKLSADCTRQNPAKTLHSSINLNDYIVNQGGLGWATHGDFQETCDADRLQVVNLFGFAEANLTANCFNVGLLGTAADATIDLDEAIANIDGKLTYVGP